MFLSFNKNHHSIHFVISSLRSDKCCSNLEDVLSSASAVLIGEGKSYQLKSNTPPLFSERRTTRSKTLPYNSSSADAENGTPAILLMGGCYHHFCDTPLFSMMTRKTI